jgi:hypothetical protein
LRQNKTIYIFIIFLLIPLKGSYAQDLSLTISSKDKIEVTVLNTIKYKKKHQDTISVQNEIDKISNYLKTIGYFSNTFDSLPNIQNKFVAYFSLHTKTDKAILRIDTDASYLFQDINIENNYFTISIHQLQATLSNLSKKLDTQGKSFSKVQLKNIKIINDTLFADLEINSSKKRFINNTIIKGYPAFPKSYLKNYFNIKPNSIFNQQKIKEISSLSKNISFVQEIKPPEVLFTKDSTALYLYLKRQTNSSIDGLVSFASKENGDVLFNGIIDLKLNNILNTGERLELFWNSIGEERQEFTLATEIPYIFNSKISPELSFNLYKQDSSFLNTKFDSKLFYNINSKIKLALTYSAESSEHLEGTINDNVETFRNYFLGFQFKYSIPKNDFFFNNIFNLEINPTFGERKIIKKASKQFKIEATVSYLWDLNFRNSLFIKNHTSYLNSDSFLNNELFRIGGANSIRGFDEQSIFTNNYSFFNIEYRFLTSQKSYLYSITDVGFSENKTGIENILGIGLGYLFATNNSLIKLSSVVGKNSSQSFNLNNSKLIVSWVSFF